MNEYTIKRATQSLPFMILGSLWLLATAVALNQVLLNLDTATVVVPLEKSDKMDQGAFKILTFGHLPAAVDWLWMSVLADPGLMQAPKGKHPGIYYDLDLITDLDSGNFESYHHGGNLLAIVRKDASGALNLVQKGLAYSAANLSEMSPEFQSRFWSDPWRLSILEAYLDLFEFEDMPRARAAFIKASEHPKAPAYTRRLAQKFGEIGGEYKVGIRLLDFLILGAKKNPELLEKLVQKKNSLAVLYHCFELRLKFIDFLRPKYKRLHDFDVHKNLTEVIDSDILNTEFSRFTQKNSIPRLDPWGGEISLDHQGWVRTQTPHEKVFGLD